MDNIERNPFELITSAEVVERIRSMIRTRSGCQYLGIATPKSEFVVTVNGDKIRYTPDTAYVLCIEDGEKYLIHTEEMCGPFTGRDPVNQLGLNDTEFGARFYVER